MIDRYTYPEMGQIWSQENEYRKWLDVELVASEAMCELGLIPYDALQVILNKANFESQRIQEIEKETQHDLIAFIQAVSEQVGDEAKYIHMGLTSSDVKDTATSLLMREAGELLLKDLHQLDAALQKRAKEHKFTVMMGRSHGVHAEPVTFGLKLALWLSETRRNIERLEAAIKRVSYGKISGAVGTYANIDPKIEELVCAKLGLSRAEVSTQILQRDRHAEFLNTLALIASSLDKFATEIRNLQRTDILEVEENFAKGQKGSSAMPHKRNPITAERVAGLARVVRANALAGMENVALWHERDMTHSSVERVILPDSCTLLDYMLKKFTNVIENLNVYPENMLNNLNRTHGLIWSQRVLLSLVDKGVTRQDGYVWVQENALRAWNKGTNFKDLVLADQRIMQHLTISEVEELFDYQYHLKHIDEIFARLGLE